MTAAIMAWAEAHDRKERNCQVFELLMQNHAGRCYYCGEPATEMHHAFLKHRPLRMTCHRCHQIQHTIYQAIKDVKANEILN